MKNKLDTFLKSELNMIIASVIVCIEIYAVFAFGHLEMQYGFLCIQIIAFLLIVYLIIKYISFKNQLTLKDELAKTLSAKKALEEQNIKVQNELKEYFMMWVHQIKTPISVAKILLEKNNSEQASELKNQIFYIEEYTSMAINYLKLMEIGADMDIASVNLDKLIKLLLKKYSLLFISKNISLEYDTIECEVVSDHKWLSVLVEQILSNALKYTEHGSISIYLEGNSLVIADTGIGIVSEDIPKIFDKGYSGLNGRLNSKSSGLGLYLAKIISHKLNLKISVESELGKGSKFYIDFGDKLTKL